MLRRLPRTAHHDSRSCLVADFLELPQVLHAVVEGHRDRMELCVVFACGRFMTQQVAVGSCPVETFVGFAGAFAEGKGDGAVGEFPADGPHDLLYPCVVERGVFPSLQYERPETQRMARPAACEYLFPGEPVAFHPAVAAANAAVVAVVAAVVRDFYQAADEDAGTETCDGHFAGRLHGVCEQRPFCRTFQERCIIFRSEVSPEAQPVHQPFHCPGFVLFTKLLNIMVQTTGLSLSRRLSSCHTTSIICFYISIVFAYIACRCREGYVVFRLSGRAQTKDVPTVFRRNVPLFCRARYSAAGVWGNRTV